MSRQSLLVEDSSLYTFIAVYPLRIDGRLVVTNPKGLMAMDREKAWGAMKWWRRIMASKNYPCFIYDPTEETIFKEDSEELDEEKVKELVKRFGGEIDFIEKQLGDAK